MDSWTDPFSLLITHYASWVLHFSGLDSSEAIWSILNLASHWLVCQHRLDFNCLLKCDRVCCAAHSNPAEIWRRGGSGAHQIWAGIVNSACVDWHTNQPRTEPRARVCGEKRCLCLQIWCLHFVLTLSHLFIYRSVNTGNSVICSWI